MAETQYSTDYEEIALTFLSRVLPPRGVYYVFCKKGNRNIACETIAEVWDVISNERAEAWIASASFQDNTSRKSDNVMLKSAYYQDVDYGPNKPYTSPQEALLAISTWLQVTGLPRPIIVATGHGFHLWWPLISPIDPSTWKRTSLNLKRLSKEHNFCADLVCVSDIARLMRCPGTINYKSAKHARVLVEPGFKGIGPYSQGEFERFTCDNVVQFPQVQSRTVFNKQARDRVVSALKALPLGYRDDYAMWFRIGAAIFELGWGKEGFVLWVAWSYKSPKFDMQAQLKTWESYARGYTGERITPGTLYALAREHGWIDKPQVSNEELNKEEPGEVSWDTNRYGERKPTLRNAIIACSLLGVKCRYNELTSSKEVIYPYETWSDGKSYPFDDVIGSVLRGHILNDFRFDPTDLCIHDAIKHISYSSSYDPLKDYITNLIWDGKPRIEHWLHQYLGVQDTRLHSAIGVLTLVAAIRRALEPGCKYDHMLILCGRQGSGKSTAVRIMGRNKFFSDQHITIHDPRTVLEVMRGVWIYEWSELAGFASPRSVERLKAIITTQIDKGRLAYGRETTNALRRTIFIGTTNSVYSQFLYDETGARRFFPVLTSRITVNELEKDMDNLYAEAKELNENYGPLVLPWEVLKEAQGLQMSFTASQSDYEEILETLVGETCCSYKTKQLGEKVSAQRVYAFLGIQPKEQTRAVAISVANTMRKLGWQKITMKIDNRITKSWVRYANPSS